MAGPEERRPEERRPEERGAGNGAGTDSVPRRDPRLPDRIEQRIVQGAVAPRVGPPAARPRVAGQADQRLLTIAPARGDGDLISRKIGIVGQKRLLHHASGQGYRVVKVDELRPRQDQAIGLARQGMVVGRPEPDPCLIP